MERHVILQYWLLVSFKTFITKKTKPKYSIKVSTTVSKSKTVCQTCRYFTLLGCVLLNLFLPSLFFSALFNRKHPEPKILYQHFFLGSQSPLFLASFTSRSTLQHLARKCSTLKSFYRF